MDSDKGKLFIRGISWETMEERPREYFHKYGEVLQAVITKDKVTGRPRGFGFILFADPSILDPTLQDKHSIDDQTIEAKHALSREDPYRQGGHGFGGGHGGDQGSGSGYMGGGCNDACGGSGYANSWRSDPSQVGASGASKAAQVNISGVMLGFFLIQVACLASPLATWSLICR